MELGVDKEKKEQFALNIYCSLSYCGLFFRSESKYFSICISFVEGLPMWCNFFYFVYLKSQVFVVCNVTILDLWISGSNGPDQDVVSAYSSSTLSSISR